MLSASDKSVLQSIPAFPPSRYDGTANPKIQSGNCAFCFTGNSVNYEVGES